MDSLSALDPLAWDPEFFKDHPAYAAGQALGCLYQGNKQAATSYPLSGRLYLSKTGWLLLAVPNALVRGVYDAMPAPGAELPTTGAMGVGEKSELLNAHITVMTGDEVTQVGADKINERGHMFGYTLGALKEIEPRSGSNLSKIWAIQVAAPLLSALRKSYGLSALPNDEPFHITVAVRKRGVLLDNGKAKGYETPTDVNDGESFEHPISRGELKAAKDTSTTYDCGCSGRCMCPDTCVCKTTGCGTHKSAADCESSSKTLSAGATDEHEHTADGQAAKEVATDHLSKDPQYYKKEKLIEQLPAKIASVYMQQLKNLASFREPIVYDESKPVYQNVVNHLFKAKQRGDHILRGRQNMHTYRTMIDPNYRYQMAMQAIHGTTPQMNPLDKTLQLYGNDIFDTLRNVGGKHV
jgi:hypothetical protein